MTIAKLQQFQAVCQFQSVTKAAEYIHISQPSVSATIRELEEEFNINLFRREGKKLVLTAEGSFLLEQADSLLGKFDELSQKMHDLGKNKNLFRLSVPPMSGTAFFPQLYKAYRARHPEINLSIIECGSLQADRLLDQGELDLAMATLNLPPDSRFETLKLGQSRLMFCVSRKHRLAGEKSVSISMLKEEPLVLFTEDSAPTKVILQMFAAKHQRPNVLLYSSQLSMIRHFISDGTAGAFLLESLIEEDPDVIALPLTPGVLFDTVLMWKRNQYMYSDVAGFIKFCRSYFA